MNLSLNNLAYIMLDRCLLILCFYLVLSFSLFYIVFAQPLNKSFSLNLTKGKRTVGYELPAIWKFEIALPSVIGDSLEQISIQIHLES